LINEFKKIWDRDTSRDKARAIKELAFVYFMGDYKSEYNSQGIEKQKMVSIDVMNDEFYIPDELIEKAIAKYTSLQETISMRYLKSVRETANSLMKFYDQLRFNSNTMNVTNYDPSAVTKALKDVESIIEKLEKWEKKVFSEEDSMEIRGGGNIGIFENPEAATWMMKK
jgi:hypothetical protein